MKDQDKTKAQLITEIEALRLRVRELEAVDKGYEELTQKMGRVDKIAGIQRGAETLGAQRDKQSAATVLVVDDNDIFRGFLAGALSHHHYHVLQAESSADALRLLADGTTPVELMIVDVVMPNVGGAELVRQIKAVYPDMKVLFMSGYTDDILVHSEVQAVLESKEAFLQKPFLTGDLLEMVQRMLGKQGI